jgi:hypothetical protein
MPESLSVAFGALLDELALTPSSVGRSYGPHSPARLATFGLGGRGLVLFTNHDEAPPHVLLVQIAF